MIPTAVLRADNRFSVPLLQEYSKSARELAETQPQIAYQLRQRAAEIDALVMEMQAWGMRNKDRILLTRTVTPADPGESATRARRQFRERSLAHDRDVRELRESLEAARRALEQERTENESLRARLRQIQPVQHVTPVQSR